MLSKLSFVLLLSALFLYLFPISVGVIIGLFFCFLALLIYTLNGKLIEENKPISVGSSPHKSKEEIERAEFEAFMDGARLGMNF
jgi:hypothetical protein